METHLWKDAVQLVKVMLRCDPESQIHDLITKYSGHEELFEEDLDDEESIANMLSFHCYLKSVGIDTYSKICSLALQIAVDRQLFRAGKNLSEVISGETEPTGGSVQPHRSIWLGC